MAAYYKGHDRLLVAVDCIIFGFDGKELKALLIRRGFEPAKGRWSLMGGFISESESVEAAASRILHNLTGLTDIYMEQISCFSQPRRDPGGRVVSVAFFALIKIDDYSEELMLRHNSKWFALGKIPSLIFDHKQMLEEARLRLRMRAASHPIGFELLPQKFTLPQLQVLYEAIFQTALDKRNFSRRIHALKLLRKLSEKEKASSRRGAFYYVFDKRKYERSGEKGVKFL
jgi:8-oxo-dGTP diphosphatase